MKPLRKKLQFCVTIIVFLLLFTGCHPHVPVPVMEFPEMHIEVDPTGEIPTRFWDAYSIFNKANHLFDDEKFLKAKALYEKILIEYPETDMAHTSLFNIGLCDEEVGEFAKAIKTYQRLEKEYPEKIDFIKLNFRYGYCFEKLEKWGDAVDHLIKIAVSPKVTMVEKVQAEARIAMATFYMGEENKAKGMLRQAMEKYENLRNRRITVDSYFYAKTCFTLGEFYLNRFRDVKLKGDQKEMGILLESKATMFTLARAQYIKAIKAHEPEYVFASLFRIGHGYEEFYFAMINAPLPKELEPNEKEEYLDKLKVTIAPVIRKAKSAYRRNIRLGADLRQKSDWIDKSKERLEYLQRWESKN